MKKKNIKIISDTTDQNIVSLPENMKKKKKKNWTASHASQTPTSLVIYIYSEVSQ